MSLSAHPVEEIDSIRSEVTSELFEEAATQLIKILHNQRNVYMSFIFYDERTHEFRQVASLNTRKLFATSRKYYRTDTKGGLHYAREAVRKLESTIGHDLKQGPWPKETKRVAERARIKSIISTPLIRNDRPFGVINFFFSRALETHSAATTQLVANCDLTAFSLVQLLENIEVRRIEENTSRFLRHEIPHMLSDIETFAERQFLRLEENKPVEANALQKISLHSKQARALIFNIGTEQRWFLQEIELRKSFNELRPFLQKVIGTYEGMGIQFTLRQSHSKPIGLYIDAGLMERAISNIIQNAVKYSLPNERIQLTVKRPGRMVEIIIVNHGPTIPKKLREFVFRKFYKIEKLRAYRIKQHGTGLGLFISKAIIESHRGRIFIGKPKGRSGCAVHILLPVTKVDMSLTKRRSRK